MSAIPREGLLRDVAVMRDTVGLGKLENSFVRSLGRIVSFFFFAQITPFALALCWQLSKVWHLADERSLVTNAAHDAKDGETCDLERKIHS